MSQNETFLSVRLSGETTVVTYVEADCGKKEFPFDSRISYGSFICFFVKIKWQRFGVLEQLYQKDRLPTHAEQSGSCRLSRVHEALRSLATAGL